MKKFLSAFSIMMIILFSGIVFSTCGSNIKLTINFDSLGGSECEPIVYKVGKSFDMPDDPLKEDYVFGGWFIDKDIWENPLTLNTIANYPLSNSVEITAYARWIPITYINFNTNGGEKINPIVYNKSKIEIPTPTREGYTFMGWFYDNGAWTQEFSIKSLENLEPKKEITIFAKWALNKYINFESNGGSVCEPINIAISTTYDMPIPTKPLFIFKGWFMDRGLNTPFDKSLINLGEYDTATVVYAKWEEKKVQNVTFYGEPKTEYVYGDEVDLNGMYAYVEYYYYEGEYINITKNMVSGFNSTKIVKDKRVKEVKNKMWISLGGNSSKSFIYTITPKYKSIEIQKDSFQSTYLIGENSKYIINNCNGKYSSHNNYFKYKALKFKVTATNFDGSTTDIDVIARSNEKNYFKTICNNSHGGIVHVGFPTMQYIITSESVFVNDLKPNDGPIIYYPIDQNGNHIPYDKFEYVDDSCIDIDNNTRVTSNAYCDISTNAVGKFTGTLYLGLCADEFEYSVGYNESEFKSFEALVTNDFVQELTKTNDASLLNKKVVISLNDGTKFEWKIDKKEYILSDFDLSTKGEKEAIVQFPFEKAGSYQLLKIKYTVISLNDIEYIDFNSNFPIQCSCSYKLDDLRFCKTYYYQGEELKSITLPWISSSQVSNNYVDLSKVGEHTTTFKICGIEVKVKYKVDSEIDKIVLKNETIELNSNVSLRDLTLYAYYKDSYYVGDLNNQAISDNNGKSWSSEGQYINGVNVPLEYYKYEILEDIDTTSLGVKQAKIKLCDIEFLINYEVVWFEIMF